MCVVTAETCSTGWSLAVTFVRMATFRLHIKQAHRLTWLAAKYLQMTNMQTLLPYVTWWASLELQLSLFILCPRRHYKTMSDNMSISGLETTLESRSSQLFQAHKIKKVKDIYWSFCWNIHLQSNAVPFPFCTLRASSHYKRNALADFPCSFWSFLMTVVTLSLKPRIL